MCVFLMSILKKKLLSQRSLRTFVVWAIIDTLGPSIYFPLDPFSEQEGGVGVRTVCVPPKSSRLYGLSALPPQKERNSFL